MVFRRIYQRRCKRVGIRQAQAEERDVFPFYEDTKPLAQTSHAGYNLVCRAIRSLINVAISFSDAAVKPRIFDAAAAAESN